MIGDLLIIISLVFGISLAVAHSIASVPCFAVALVSIVYLLYASQIAQKETRGSSFEPVMFFADRNHSFRDVTAFFETITQAEDRLAIAEDVRLYRAQLGFKLRVVVFRTAAFDKKTFDDAKGRINKRANKEWNVSQWVSLEEAAKMMRLNIICADEMNTELHSFLSQNAEHNLSRAEGILNMAIVGNRIVIPPLYGSCYLAEIRRYEGVIRFIERAFCAGEQMREGARFLRI